MATVTKDSGPAPRPAREGQRAPVAVRLSESGHGLWKLIRRNWLFTVAFVLAIVPRVIAMLGFGPAMLFRMDSFDYLWGASHLSPNVINPSGYSVFLWLLKPFHSLVLVVVIQHLMGLAIAVMLYAVLKRRGLPAWGATLAALPVLFDPAQILSEQMIMADLLAMFMVVAGFALLLFGESVPLWRIVLSGLLMGASVTVRPDALAALILVPIYLLLQRVGWRAALASLVAGLLPVVAYMGWFDSVHGSFNMTESNGLFLWTRTMSFANCRVIKPPRDLAALCPNRQQGKLLGNPDPALRPLPKYYLWDRKLWQWQPPSHMFVIDAAPFTKANNSRAMRFAIDAIKAQPFAYAGVILKEALEPFTQVENLQFPVTKANNQVNPLPPGNLAYAVAAVRDYGQSGSWIQHVNHDKYSYSYNGPMRSLMGDYQKNVFLPGPVLGAVLLIGLAGLFIPRRRSWAGAMLWLSAVSVILLSIAEHEYTYRYVIAAVPLLVMAAAFVFVRPAPQEVAASDEGSPVVPAAQNLPAT